MTERKPNVLQFSWVSAKNLLFAQLADQTWVAVKFYWPEPREEICGQPKSGRDKYGRIVMLKPAKTRLIKPATPEPEVRSCVLNVEGNPMFRSSRDLVRALPETYTRNKLDFRIDAQWGKIFPAMPLETGSDGKPIIRADMYTRCKQFTRMLRITDSGSYACPTEFLPLEAQKHSHALTVNLPDDQLKFVSEMAKAHGISSSAEVAAMVQRAVSGS